MTDFDVFVALCKGYCAINILILPKNFQNGGWLIGILAIILGGWFVCVCALKLVECAFECQKFDFREVARSALGSTGCHVISIVLAVIQFSFTIAQISFTLKAIESIILESTGNTVNLWYIAFGVIVIYSPIAWVRRISVWRKGYSLAIFMILFTALVIMVYSIHGLATTGPVNDGFKMVNPSKLFDMVGFAFYTFEGIGTVLPVLKESKNPFHFPRLLVSAFVFLCSLFCIFALISYMYFGTQKEPIIINNIENPTVFMRVVKVMYCVNLMFSYPLSIYPTNSTIETYLYSGIQNESVKYWVCNFSRFLVCFAACFCAIIFHSILDQFLGLTGAILGIPIILIVPLLCHYKLCAIDRFQRGVDVVLISISIFVSIICSYMNFVNFLADF